MRLRIAFACVLIGLSSAVAQDSALKSPSREMIFDVPKAAPIVEAQATVPAPPAAVSDSPAGGLLVAPPPKIWSGYGEIGLNGANGNSDLFNIRGGFNATRKTATNLLTADFLYSYATQNDVLTQNQLLINARDEILFPGTPWSVFGATNLEYDELRAYRFRFGLYGGVGYQLIDNEKMNWRVRAGAGTVFEDAGYDGGPESRFVPELILGTDFSYKFDDRQSFEATLDYFPRVDSFSQFRVRARAAYQVILDKDNGIIFRIGAQNRYDSDPGTAKANDLTYFAMLGFKF